MLEMPYMPQLVMPLLEIITKPWNKNNNNPNP